MKIYLGAAYRDVSGIKVRASNTWRTIVQGKQRISGAWVEVCNFAAPPATEMSVSVSPTSLDKTASGVDAGTQTTSPTTCTPANGSAPYSYLWEIVSDDGLASYAINSPTSPSTTVTASGLIVGAPVALTIHCTVTDSLGTVKVSDAVSISFERTA